MRILFWLSLVGVTYGSLYPFNFVARGPGDIDWIEALSVNSAFDMVNNVILFLPIGVCARLIANGFGKTWRRYVAIALAIAILAQVGQVFVPSRYPGVLDVLMNGAGLFLGGWLASLLILRLKRSPAPRYVESEWVVPVVLIVAFLTFQLNPHVPALDWPHLKASARQVMYQYRSFQPMMIVTGFALWFPLMVLFMPMVRRMEWRIIFLFLAPVIFFARVLVWGNAPSPWEFVGAFIGVGLYLVMIGRSYTSHVALICVILAIAIEGLLPAFPRQMAQPFSWVPFDWQWQSPRQYFLLVITKKVFLFGAMIYFARELHIRPRSILGLGVPGLLAIEYYQIHFVSGRPEITDPILFAMLAASVFFISRPRDNL